METRGFPENPRNQRVPNLPTRCSKLKINTAKTCCGLWTTAGVFTSAMQSDASRTLSSNSTMPNAMPNVREKYKLNLLQVHKVNIRPGYRLHLAFNDGTQREFDMFPLLGKKPFLHLKDPVVFSLAKVADGAVTWPRNVVISSDVLYANSRICQQ